MFKEWVHSGKTDADIADYVAGEKFQLVFPDPENQGGIEELRRRHVNLRDVKKGKGSVVGGINVVRELFKNNRLFISSDCVNLILELETYSYGDNDKENPLKENDDCVDGMRYPLMMDAQSSTRRTAEITLGNQKHYGADEYAPIIMEEGYTPHRYEV